MKRSLIFYSLGGTVLIAIVFFVIRSISNSGYAKQLPDVPELTSSNKALKEQITKEAEKAVQKPTAENIGELAMVYHSSAFYERAAQCYRLAMKIDKKNWRWPYYLGYLDKEMGDSKSAVENFRQVININPNIYYAWYYAGEAFQNLNYNEQAEVSFKKLIYKDFSSGTETVTTNRVDFFPLDTYARYQLARIYLSTKQLDKAEAILNEIISQHHSFGPAYRLIGNLYNAKGDSAWSKYYIIRANDLSPFAAPVDTIADKLAMLSRSEMYLLKQIDESEKSMNIEWTNALVNHAMTYLPDNQYLIAKALKIYLKMDNGPKAIALIDKHLAAYQNQFNEIQEVADLFFDKRLYAPASRYYAQGLKLKPNDVKLESRLAMSQWQSDQKDEAHKVAQQLLKDGQPDQLASGINLLLMFGEKQQAQSYLNKLKQLAPSAAQTKRLEGLTAEYDGHPELAIKYYEAAFQKEPENMTNVKNLVELLFRQKDWKEALTRLGEAMKVHPNEPYVLERTGTLLVTCENQSLRNVNLGKELSERAFFHSTALPETMLSAGRSLVLACAMQHDYTSAKKYMTVVLNLASNQNLPKAYTDDLLKINSSLQAHM